jgi:hypothetical protein
MTDPFALGHRHADERAAAEAPGSGGYAPLMQAHEADLQAALRSLDKAGRKAFELAYRQGALTADRARFVAADLEALPPDPGPVAASPSTPLRQLRARRRFLDVCARGQAMYDALDPAHVTDPKRPLVSADAFAICTELVRIDAEIARREANRRELWIVLALGTLAAAFVIVLAWRM